MKTIPDNRRLFISLAAAAVVGLLLAPASLAGGERNQEANSWQRGGHSVRLHNASGGGTFTADSNNFRFAFGGRELHSKGRAQGYFEFHNLTTGKLSSLYMKIVRLVVLDESKSTVGLIMEIERGVKDGSEDNTKIGECRAVKLRDNGEGQSSPLLDLASKLFNCQGEYLEDAASWDLPAFNLNVIDGGHIQIN